MMIEVFKTNVQDASQSAWVIQKLLEHLPGCRANFDLDDCDRILRIQHEHISVSCIIELIKALGYHAEVLD